MFKVTEGLCKINFSDCLFNGYHRSDLAQETFMQNTMKTCQFEVKFRVANKIYDLNK